MSTLALRKPKQWLFANGTVVASSYVRYPLIQETEGMAEQDPETLFQAVVNCIRTVTQQVKNQPIGLIFLLQRCMA